MRSATRTKIRLAQILGIAAFFLFFGLSGCQGISTQSGSGSCASNNTVTINVYDSYSTRVCGCNEGQGQFAQDGSSQCTFTVGATVYFVFVGISGNHVITITDVGSTSTVGPGSSIMTAAITVNKTGTFSFIDSFNGLGGSFVVTP